MAFEPMLYNVKGRTARAEACRLSASAVLNQDYFLSSPSFQPLHPIAFTFAMASLALPSLLRTSARSVRRSPLPALVPSFTRSVSTKHPAGFTPPTDDDLLELRERVQDFTSILLTLCALVGPC